MTKVLLALALFALYAHIDPVDSRSLYLPTPLNNTDCAETSYKIPKPSGSQLAVTINQQAPSTKGPVTSLSQFKLPALLCGASSYFSNTNMTTSALAADCLKMGEEALEQKHFWLARGFTDNHTLVHVRSHGTCHFGIRPETMENIARTTSGWYVGNKDIYPIKKRVVKDFSLNGRAGASGLMHCDVSDQVGNDIHWAIYGPGELEKVGWNWAPPVPSAAGKARLGMTLVLAVALGWIASSW